MTDERRNVELKAHDDDPARTLAACRELGARDQGVLRQRDTYFELADGCGRLKLREEDPGVPYLVHYARPVGRQQRESRYRVAEVADAATTRVLLDAALGVECVVAKERHLFLWEGVRIHLDRVDGLGTFVELEAVADRDSDLALEHSRVATLRTALAIYDDRLVAVGYAELLRAQRPATDPTA